MSGLGSELLCGGAAGQPYPIDFAGVVSGPKETFIRSHGATMQNAEADIDVL